MKKFIFLIMIVPFAFTVTAQNFTINTTKSVLKWTGKKVTGEHWGYVNLKDG